MSYFGVSLAAFSVWRFQEKSGAGDGNRLIFVLMIHIFICNWLSSVCGTCVLNLFQKYFFPHQSAFCYIKELYTAYANILILHMTLAIELLLLCCLVGRSLLQHCVEVCVCSSVCGCVLCAVIHILNPHLRTLCLHKHTDIHTYSSLICWKTNKLYWCIQTEIFIMCAHKKIQYKQVYI